jgi:hypothetical protein
VLEVRNQDGNCIGAERVGSILAATGRGTVWAALMFLEAHRPSRRGVVMGTSMGAAVAIFAASELSLTSRATSWRAPIRI